VDNKLVWPPDYTTIFKERQDRFLQITDSLDLQTGSLEYYRRSPVEFINDWCVTYDPRNVSMGLPTLMPFYLFPKQVELTKFLYDCVMDRESGLIEKCRDMGATWVCVAFSVWLWLFHEGAAIGWGSRKEQLVDKIGDPSSIFEKIRMTLQYLPVWFLPPGFRDDKHSSFMKLMNPDTNATIMGEGGDNIGRGGRTTVYFKDEAQPLDEPVLTPCGWREIGSLVAGDIIIGADGENKSVLGVNDCGVSKIYKITLSDGSTTRASENHVWEVEYNRAVKKLRTKDLGEFHIYSSPGGQKHYPIIIKGPNIKPDHKSMCLHPYIVGALLGDGSVTENGFGITSADPFIPEKISLLMPEGSSLKYRKDYWYQFLRDDGRGGKGKKSSIRTAVEASGIWGMKCKNKRIPTEYISSGYEVLRGLMDTDGSCYNGTSVFVNSSYGLCLDVQTVSRRLGGKASIKKRNDGTWVVYINTPDCPFSLPRKVDKWNPKQSFSRRVKSVEYIGEMDARCITVEDSLYITNDYIVTHNSAHYERGDKIEAALSDNTDVQIDISSVNGPGTIFHRRRIAGQVYDPTSKNKPLRGVTRIFIMDWRDHPAKDQDWYDAREAKAQNEGLIHIFRQEIDRDYSSAVEGVLIPGKWVRAARDAHKILGFEAEGKHRAGFDPYDEGMDSHAFVSIKGSVFTYVEAWGEGDTGQATNKAIDMCRDLRVRHLQYDSPGVGAGVKSETNRLRRVNELPNFLDIVAWNGGKRVLNPFERLSVMENEALMIEEYDEENDDSPKNRDFYKNLKAQGGWNLRRRFERTYQAVTQGVKYDPSYLISIPSDIINRDMFENELSQPTYKKDPAGKITINKQPDGTKSPNLYDAAVMATWEVKMFDPASMIVLGGPDGSKEKRVA
jgi:hypothetical protein